MLTLSRSTGRLVCRTDKCLPIRMKQEENNFRQLLPSIRNSSTSKCYVFGSQCDGPRSTFVLGFDVFTISARCYDVTTSFLRGEEIVELDAAFPDLNGDVKMMSSSFTSRILQLFEFGLQSSSRKNFGDSLRIGADWCISCSIRAAPALGTAKTSNASIPPSFQSQGEKFFHLFIFFFNVFKIILYSFDYY